MNDYEQKQENKRDRLRVAADKRRREADKLYRAGKTALEMIPFGQPILAGHHSEKSDRSYRSRSVGKIDRSFELTDEATALEARAESVGNGGISSDDPDASDKLRAKLDQLRETHASMVAANKEARSTGQRKPYLAYQLANSRQNITRITERVAQLAKRASTQDSKPIIGKGWSITENRLENRIVIAFTERQPADIVQLLRARGFLWSPSRTAWVRKITDNAICAARQVSTLLTNRPTTKVAYTNQPAPPHA